MAFAVGVEMLNLRVRKHRDPVQLRRAGHPRQEAAQKSITDG
jgi:hypothetical protein